MGSDVTRGGMSSGVDWVREMVRERGLVSVTGWKMVGSRGETELAAGLALREIAAAHARFDGWSDWAYGDVGTWTARSRCDVWIASLLIDDTDGVPWSKDESGSHSMSSATQCLDNALSLLSCRWHMPTKCPSSISASQRLLVYCSVWK